VARAGILPQARVGLAGHSFDVLKFRSMRTDAERDGQAQWRRRRSTRHTRRRGDPDAAHRRLPQILNVLRGHMSFVGPRRSARSSLTSCGKDPVLRAASLCEARHHRLGAAVLSYGSSEQDALEKLQYDLYYIKNNSLLFDLAILVQTAEVVLLGKGAR